MGYDTIHNFYKSNFNLMQFHHWNLGDIMDMVPWERHVYLEMLNQHIQQEKEKQRELEAQRRINVR